MNTKEMSRRLYVENSQSLPLRYLLDLVRNPGHTSPRNILLTRVAIRRKMRALKED